MRRALVLLLAGALVGALAWGTCNNSRASDATKQLQAILAQHDRDAARDSAHHDSLAQAVRVLRADSAFLDAQRRAVRAQSRDSIGKLLALVQDSAARVVAHAAVRVVYLEVEACQDQLSNCEARAQNAEARARGDSVSLARTEVILDSVRVAWSQAERAARPSFFRDLYRSRAVTLPLAVLSAVLILKQ